MALNTGSIGVTEAWSGALELRAGNNGRGYEPLLGHGVMEAARGRGPREVSGGRERGPREAGRSGNRGKMDEGRLIGG